ncbi:5-oxoprolinase subunit PxpB [Marinobacter sp. 71-i]|uniref:5-oxoprolinase subunit PxpB n=1 Tax=Marinobacter iranensis TaxID=2962607 RepID=A0ABT5YB24_9GAMM|nr:5-oxoprolinase subunit PxpB [Marinobacter iranensis]MDF0750265.1 5-oxoprolinase subunit PxpB [Marinobacter iranensis]
MISAVSEDSFLITLSDTVSEDLPARLGSLCDCIEGQNWPWLTDLVPSYTTLLVVYDPLQVDFRQVEAALKTVVSKAPTAGNETTDSHRREVIRIPVYYSPESGPDLESLAAACELSVDEVIRRHTAETYQVYAIGFAPGFGFMGQVDPSIAHPRKETPRSHVPAGSVGIANRQTAVYPVASPGGWQLIGLSPLRLFDSEKLSLLRAGDRVRFLAITRDEYLEQGGAL